METTDEEAPSPSPSPSSGSGADREADVRASKPLPLSPPRDSLAAAESSSSEAVAGRIALPATACSRSQARDGTPERRTSNVIDKEEEEPRATATATAPMPGGGLATGHSGALLHAPCPDGREARGSREADSSFETERRACALVPDIPKDDVAAARREEEAGAFPPSVGESNSGARERATAPPPPPPPPSPPPPLLPLPCFSQSPSAAET